MQFNRKIPFEISQTKWFWQKETSIGAKKKAELFVYTLIIIVLGSRESVSLAGMARLGLFPLLGAVGGRAQIAGEEKTGRGATPG